MNFSLVSTFMITEIRDYFSIEVESGLFMRLVNSFIHLLFIFLMTLFPAVLFAQDQKPVIKAHQIAEKISLDGILNEDEWDQAPEINSLTMVEPETGGPASLQTTVKILMDKRDIYIGIICHDDPKNIVAYSKARDSDLKGEDYVKFVLDTYLDGRTGFIFAINPFGARYDALVARFGESENSNWDAVWSAKTKIHEEGWTSEIRIPVKTLSFNKKIEEWGFNIERKIQRKLEIDRWTAISKDIKLGQTSNAGLLTNLPDFNLGIGLIVRGSSNLNFTNSVDTDLNTKWHNSLDLTERFTPDITGQLTVNTDFAETEVDSRRTNLTRFPLFYPEKRDFFLQGADIYEFGMGLGFDIVPYFSRKIGLFEGKQVPLLVGGKLDGKLGKTNFGGLVTHMGKVDSLVPKTTLGVARVKQNIGKESRIGFLTTLGDPEGRANSFTAGVDYTYNTSSFKGDKNLLVGAWGLINNRDSLSGDKSAFGVSLDYPNDLWDIFAGYKRIGNAFDPSLGFVPRKGVNMYRLGADFMPRPNISFIRQFFFESSFSMVTDLSNTWESYRLFTAPIHFKLESGDRFEFNIVPVGEQLKVPFEIADGVIIQEGAYHWIRYRLELEIASKRRVSGQISWWFGGFYDGTLDQIELELFLRPFSFLNFEFSFERNLGNLPEGRFVQDLWAGRVMLNFSSDLQLSSFIQYDNESRNLGSNTRLRWTFSPKGDLFVVYNHNMINDVTDRFGYQSNQLILKLTYAIWL